MTYKFYTIAWQDDGYAVSRDGDAATLYVAASVAAAKSWIDAYSDGRTWAVMAALP